MSRHTHITFYRSETGGKYHLPTIGWDSDMDFIACRPTALIDTHHTVWSTVDKIEAKVADPFICKRCARIAVSTEGGRS